MKWIKGKPTCTDCGQVYTTRTINGNLYVAHLCEYAQKLVKKATA